MSNSKKAQARRAKRAKQKIRDNTNHRDATRKGRRERVRDQEAEGAKIKGGFRPSTIQKATSFLKRIISPSEGRENRGYRRRQLKKQEEIAKEKGVQK